MSKKSSEQLYLADLINDFGVSPKITSSLAVYTIQSRYSVITTNIVLSKHFLGSVIDLDFFSAELPQKLHQFLYSGILSNAGKYRSVNEPKEGEVLFGVRQQFRGTHPLRIEDEINHTFELLNVNNDPVHSIAQFYQRFVQIHPFYDANGRIGRIIVSFYLDEYGLYINWEKLESNSQWIKYLNNCHKRFGKFRYEHYLNRHIRHWMKFIKPKSMVHADFE